MSILTDLRAAVDDNDCPVILVDRVYLRALLDVAEAAREVGIYIDEDYFNADEERVFGRLAASLAPLVKEATDE